MIRLISSSAAALALGLLPSAPAWAQAEQGGAARALDQLMRKPHDLSVWSMFANADIVVKAVMIGLVFASIMTWTIFIAKTIQVRRASAILRSKLTQLSEARGLAEARLVAGTDEGFVGALIAAATRELRLSSDSIVASSVKDRIASSFSEIERMEAQSMRAGTGILASIGSTGPFIGLFGTVWGIMNSFIGISKAQTTNLAVVAPGIAEALLATAMGLVAAIPAVLIYNYFARSIAAYMEIVGMTAGEVSRIVSRDLDRGTRSVPMSRAAE